MWAFMTCRGASPGRPGAAALNYAHTPPLPFLVLLHALPCVHLGLIASGNEEHIRCIATVCNFKYMVTFESRNPVPVDLATTGNGMSYRHVAEQTRD